MKQIFKTTMLLALLTGLFMAVGFLLGGARGAFMGLILAAISNFFTYWFSSSLVLKLQGARPLEELDNAHARDTIARIVKELADADDLPMPKLYFVDSPIPNAFATGRSPQHAVVAVMTGILPLLTDNELKAVIGHELGHVKNRDMLVSTIAATLAGAISFIAQMAMFFGSDDENRNPLAALAMLILAPLAAMLIQLAVSRSREFLADEHGDHLMGGGKDLANALRKLEDFKQSVPPIQPTPSEQSTAHLLFANPFTMSGFAGLFSTHPSTEARIARLQQLDMQAGKSGPILERR